MLLLQPLHNSTTNVVLTLHVLLWKCLLITWPWPSCTVQLLQSCFLCVLQLSELFVAFEDKPQGAASLAQVHKAVLHDGRTVAVKVQHPKVQRQSTKDIMVMEVSALNWLENKIRWRGCSCNSGSMCTVFAVQLNSLQDIKVVLNCGTTSASKDCLINSLVVLADFYLENMLCASLLYTCIHTLN